MRLASCGNGSTLASLSTNSGTGETRISTRHERHGLAVRERPEDRPLVAVLQPAEPGTLRHRRRRSHACGEHRDQRLRDHERRHHRDDDRDRDVHQEDRHLVLLAEHHRQEDDDRRQRAGQHRNTDLAHARERRRHRPSGLELPVPEDALGDHDRVVDQHADREQHAHHGQHVEREAEEVHRAERHEQRRRHGQAHDQRRRQVAQEERAA